MLAYSQFESIPSYNFLGFFTSHKSKGRCGKISSVRTEGGHRRYEVKDLIGSKKEKSLTVAYARVSSPDQKDDLKRQELVLESYCAKQGYDFELISDLGNGRFADAVAL